MDIKRSFTFEIFTDLSDATPFFIKGLLLTLSATLGVAVFFVALEPNKEVFNAVPEIILSIGIGVGVLAIIYGVWLIGRSDMYAIRQLEVARRSAFQRDMDCPRNQILYTKEQGKSSDATMRGMEGGSIISVAFDTAIFPRERHLKLVVDNTTDVAPLIPKQ